jgi:hypothetical protein
MADLPKLERLGGLWRRKSKQGREYLAGTAGELKILIFPNREKRDERAPDFVIFKSNAPARTDNLFARKPHENIRARNK